MHQMVYVSSAVSIFNSNELEELLRKSRAANQAASLTGALLYKDGNFFQVLEGPQDALHRTYAKISQDPRHRGMLRLLSRPITERSFPDWSMGWARSDAPEATNLPGWRQWQQMAESARCAKARILIDVFRRQHS